MKKFNNKLDEVIKQNSDKLKFASKGITSGLPKSSWLDAYKDGGKYFSKYNSISRFDEGGVTEPICGPGKEWNAELKRCIPILTEITDDMLQPGWEKPKTAARVPVNEVVKSPKFDLSQYKPKFGGCDNGYYKDENGNCVKYKTIEEIRAESGVISNDPVDESLTQGSINSNSFLRNWYARRAKDPRFTKIANARYKVVDEIGINPISKQQQKEKQASAWYTPIPGNKNISLNINDPRSRGASTQVHEKRHALDTLVPQPNQNTIITNIIGKNKTAPGYSKSLTIAEVPSRLDQFRRRYNIDPNKKYTREEMKKIIDYHRHHSRPASELDEEIQSGDSDIDVLLDLIGDDPEKLLQLNDQLVKSQQSIGADMARWGGPTRINKFDVGGDTDDNYCYDDKGNVIPCEQKRLQELGADAYTAMQPFYDTVFEAGNKYANPKTGITSPFNSLRATLKGLIKHPEVMFMKRHHLPSDLISMDANVNPYHVQGYYTPLPTGKQPWRPTQWAEPRKQRPGLGDWFNKMRIRQQENKAERQGRKNRGRIDCPGANCYDVENMDQAAYGGEMSIPFKNTRISMFVEGGLTNPCYDKQGNVIPCPDKKKPYRPYRVDYTDFRTGKPASKWYESAEDADYFLNHGALKLVGPQGVQGYYEKPPRKKEVQVSPEEQARLNKQKAVEDTTKSFLEKWYNSPMHREMLKNSLNRGLGLFLDKRADKMTQDRLKTLPDIKVNVAKMPEAIFDFSDINTLGYVNKDNPSLININAFSTVDDAKGTGVHEGSHLADYAVGIPKKDVKRMRRAASTPTDEYGEYVVGDKSGTEPKARIYGGRYELEKAGIYDPFTEKLSKEKFEKAEREIPEFKSINDELRTIYSTDEILNFYNTISKSDNAQSQTMAKYGGDISIPDLDADNWLMKYENGGPGDEKSQVMNILSNLPIYSPDARYSEYKGNVEDWRNNLNNTAIEDSSNLASITGFNTPGSYFDKNMPSPLKEFPYSGTVQLDASQFNPIDTRGRVLKHELAHAAFDGSNFIPNWYADNLYNTARNPSEFEKGAHQNLMNERAAQTIGIRGDIINKYGLKPDAKIPRDLYDSYLRDHMNTNLRTGQTTESGELRESLFGARNATDLYNLLNMENIPKQKDGGSWLTKYGPGGATTDGCKPYHSKNAKGECVPEWMNFRMPTNRTDVPVTIQEKLRKEAEAEEFNRRNRVTAKRQFVGPARLQTDDEKRINEQKKRQYASQSPNAVYNEETGSLETKNPDRDLEGRALPNTTAAGIDKGMSHFMNAIEATTALTGAGQIGSNLLRLGASGLEKAIGRNLLSRNLKNLTGRINPTLNAIDEAGAYIQMDPVGIMGNKLNANYYNPTTSLNTANNTITGVEKNLTNSAIEGADVVAGQNNLENIIEAAKKNNPNFTERNARVIEAWFNAKKRKSGIPPTASEYMDYLKKNPSQKRYTKLTPPDEIAKLKTLAEFGNPQKDAIFQFNNSEYTIDDYFPEWNIPGTSDYDYIKKSGLNLFDLSNINKPGRPTEFNIDLKDFDHDELLKGSPFKGFTNFTAADAWRNKGLSPNKYGGLAEYKEGGVGPYPNFPSTGMLTRNLRGPKVPSMKKGGKTSWIDKYNF